MRYPDVTLIPNQSSMFRKSGEKRPPDSIKQGSDESDTITYGIEGTMMFVTETYNNLLKEGVAPEMARMVLPQNLYTEWYWSGTLYAFSRVCNLRCAEDTQSETRTIADGIRDICAKEFPISWKELLNDDGFISSFKNTHKETKRCHQRRWIFQKCILWVWVQQQNYQKNLKKEKR